MLEIIFGTLCVLVCGFYLYILLQFRGEYLRTRRKSNSATYLGSSEGPTILFPENSEKRGGVERKSRGKKTAAADSRRTSRGPAAKAAETESQAARKPNRLPYLEMMLPITAVVTPLTTGADEIHINIPARQRA